MKRLKYAVILLLGLSIVIMASCTKDPDNGGNGGGNNGGGNTYNGHEYVDLGLPSGTLWATCNVGADTPEGYGDYFAWAETTPKTTYDWITYKYSNYDGNGSSYQFTKYCNDEEYGYNGFTDGLTSLQPEDDAATVKWGTGWRTPTADELRELYQYTTNVWTTQNGVKGRSFSASNGQSIFLPATGKKLPEGLVSVGTYGDYWSSSLYNNSMIRGSAYHLYAHSDKIYVDDIGRSVGMSVRPVRSR